MNTPYPQPYTNRLFPLISSDVEFLATYFSVEGTDATGTDADAIALDYITPVALKAGTYRVDWSGDCSIDNPTDSIRFGVMNATTATQIAYYERFVTNPADLQPCTGWREIVVAAGPLQIQITLGTSSVLSTAQLYAPRLSIRRVL